MTLYLILGLLLVILCIALFLILQIYQNQKAEGAGDIKGSLSLIQATVKESEKSIKEEFAINRRETHEFNSAMRSELGSQLNNFTGTFLEQQQNLTQSNAEKLEYLRKTIEEKLDSFQQMILSSSSAGRTEIKETLEGVKNELNEALKDYKERLREQFSDFDKSQKMLNEANSERITELRQTLEKSVKGMQEGNEKKLEEMRRTVDEKLNETLEKRLGESFKQVSDRLEAVHKGLGEMQTLAGSVGDLKKVMTNVKSRGVLGEYQLQSLLEDLLTNEQYEKNVKTKQGSGALVEFAIKMPHGGNLEKTLWLPIDSKFPKEDYESLVDAYESGDLLKIEEYRKSFVRGIRKNAQDIKEKYIDPPNTTEYGIMFLPFESLYSEVLRVPGLFDQLQREYKITITGPTTLSALLNSLQMGFRTLAIEKRSSEVWDLLGAVKTEFGKFGEVLAKTKKKLQEATNVIAESEQRTRVIEKKLKTVQELPSAVSANLIENSNEIIFEENTEDN